MNSDNVNLRFQFLKSRLEAQDRAKESLNQNIRDAARNYYTFITPITALVIYLLEARFNIILLCVVLGIMSFFGVFIFLSLLGIDTQKTHINLLSNSICEEINKIAKGTADLPVNCIFDVKRFKQFISVEGILRRAWDHRGYKSQIGLLNCSFFTACIVIPLWQANPIYASFMIPILFLLTALAHVFYAHWHSEKGLKSFPNFPSEW